MVVLCGLWAYCALPHLNLRIPKEDVMAGPKIKTPHLLASGNPVRLLSNITHLITKQSVDSINKEVERNVVALFRLGESHLNFATSTTPVQWRQRISRFYYAGYNTRRSIVLNVDGSFSTDSSDHSNVNALPKDFPDAASAGNKLKVLREDRNLADYSHDSDESELVMTQLEAEVFVSQFIADARAYLKSRGVAL
jgi:hypothetical protein